MASMVARYYHSERAGHQLKLKVVYWDVPWVEEEKLLRAAPYLLFECNPSNRGKAMPVFADPPPSDRFLRKARALYRTAPFTLFTDEELRERPDNSDTEEEEPEVVDEPEPESEKVTREAQEQRKLWAESVLFPQEADGFEPD